MRFSQFVWDFTEILIICIYQISMILQETHSGSQLVFLFTPIYNGKGFLFCYLKKYFLFFCFLLAVLLSFCNSSSEPPGWLCGWSTAYKERLTELGLFSLRGRKIRGNLIWSWTTQQDSTKKRQNAQWSALWKGQTGLRYRFFFFSPPGYSYVTHFKMILSTMHYLVSLRIHF